MERAVVLTQGGGQPQASPALGDLVAQYSTILASQVKLPRILTCFPVSALYQHCHICLLASFGLYPKVYSDPQIVKNALNTCNDRLSSLSNAVTLSMLPAGC